MALKDPPYQTPLPRAGFGFVVDGLSNGDDVEQPVEPGEVGWIACEQRHVRGESGRGDEQVDRSTSAGFRACRGDRGADGAQDAVSDPGRGRRRRLSGIACARSAARP